MRAFASVALFLVALAPLAPAAVEQERGGQEEFGPYEVVANWPQPLPSVRLATNASLTNVPSLRNTCNRSFVRSQT